MKNYIANERGDWATSSGYIKYSLGRSIHYGRLYTHGDRKEADMCEALRCLGQGLHTLEDFAAHSNYCELAIREMGFLDVFPHTGTATKMNVQGRHVFPLVTGTFGMVDFFHSVLGEATDHVTQSEVNEMDQALGDAQDSSIAGALGNFAASLNLIPGTGSLVSEAEHLKRSSDAQEASNRHAGYDLLTRAYSSASPKTGTGQLPSFDPQTTIKRIYPILAFRDRVVRKLTAVIETVPGLEAFFEKVTETLSIFIMSLLAPFVRPIIRVATRSLQDGSAGVLHASSQHQFEPWTDPMCTDPTHSLLSKDHFANVLNEPAGKVASVILKFVAPRVLYAWEHPHVREEDVLFDCVSVLHHPALRDMRNEAHAKMFHTMEHWVQSSQREDGLDLNDILGAEGVRWGRNNGGQIGHSHDPSRQFTDAAHHQYPYADDIAASNYTRGGPRDYSDEHHHHHHHHHRHYPHDEAHGTHGSTYNYDYYPPPQHQVHSHHYAYPTEWQQPETASSYANQSEPPVQDYNYGHSHAYGTGDGSYDSYARHGHDHHRQHHGHNHYHY